MIFAVYLAMSRPVWKRFCAFMRATDSGSMASQALPWLAISPAAAWISSEYWDMTNPRVEKQFCRPMSHPLREVYASYVKNFTEKISHCELHTETPANWT